VNQRARWSYFLRNTNCRYREGMRISQCACERVIFALAIARGIQPALQLRDRMHRDSTRRKRIAPADTCSSDAQRMVPASVNTRAGVPRSIQIAPAQFYSSALLPAGRTPFETAGDMRWMTANKSPSKPKHDALADTRRVTSLRFSLSIGGFRPYAKIKMLVATIAFCGPTVKKSIDALRSSSSKRQYG